MGVSKNVTNKTQLLINVFLYYRSQHYDNLQQVADIQIQQQQQPQHTLQKQPLKDTTNTNGTKQKVNNNNEDESNNQSDSTQHNTRENTNEQQQDTQQQQQPGSRSLQCLETLAQKAGIHDITPEDCKYDIANTLLNLDRIHDHSLKPEFVKVEYNLSDNMSDLKNQQVM